MEIVFALTAAVVVAVALSLELRFFAPQRASGRGEAIGWAAGWLLFALAVAAGIALADGPAGEWTTVYLIERSLSLDNVFLFSLLIAYFLVPPDLRGRALAIGIVGALLLRALAISAGVALVDAIEAVLYVFGALLLYVAYRALRSSPEAWTRPRIGRCVSFAAPSRSPTSFAGAGWSYASTTASYGTPLLLVVAAIVVADIAFAIDSIPAAFAVTRDPVVIWTANAFALLGLASLVALIDLLVRRFRYVDETIALVGIKILLQEVIHVGDLATLAIIAVLLAAGVGASLVADRLVPHTRPPKPSATSPLPARTAKSSMNHPRLSLSVSRTDNVPRVRDGYVSRSVCGHLRAPATRAEGPICRINVLANARACTRVPLPNFHGK